MPSVTESHSDTDTVTEKLPHKLDCGNTVGLTG